MEEIWKFPVQVKNDFSISMPIGARILCVQVQKQFPVLWAIIDLQSKYENRNFKVIGTGHPYEKIGELVYIGSFQLEDGNFLGHLFEEK